MRALAAVEIFRNQVLARSSALNLITSAATCHPDPFAAAGMRITHSMVFHYVSVGEHKTRWLLQRRFACRPLADVDAQRTTVRVPRAPCGGIIAVNRILQLHFGVLSRAGLLRELAGPAGAHWTVGPRLKLGALLCLDRRFRARQRTAARQRLLPTPITPVLTVAAPAISPGLEHYKILPLAVGKQIINGHPIASLRDPAKQLRARGQS